MATTAGSAGTGNFSMRGILAPLVAIIVGVFMVVLDATAVNVAVPSLVRELHSSLSTIQWTITGYALAQAAVIPLAGWLSDRFGAKNIFLISIALFTIGSALCATAQSDGMLVLFRILQGLGGGFVLPISMAYVYRLSPPERVGAVMGMMGIPILLAPAIGPVLAGWLVQYASWRWIFLLNVPVGVIGVVAAWRTLPLVERQKVTGLDLPGMILGPLAFASLSYGVSQGSTSWTSTKTIGGIVIGAIALLLFVVAELRSSAPLLELRVFKSGNFTRGILVQWVSVFALFGALFLVPLFLQQVRHYGAFDTGLILLPQAIAAALIMPVGGALFDRIGARPLVVAGLGVVAVATFILSSVSLTTTGMNLILPLALAGGGMGLMMMPVNTYLINAAPRELVSRVTSLSNAAQQVVNSLTVALLATLLTSRTTTRIGAARSSFLAAHPHAKGQVLLQLQAAIGRAFALAFDDTFKVMVVVAIIGALMGFRLRPMRATEAAGSLAEAEPHGATAPAMFGG